MMTISFLWVSLSLLIVASVGQKKKVSSLIGALGWLSFAAYWAMEPPYHLGIGDIFNAVLTVLVCIFCIFIAFFNVRIRYGKRLDILHMVTRATVIGGVFYFLFAEISILNTTLIEAVTSHTVFCLNLLNAPAARVSSHIICNQCDIELILACTGIESMALFAGVTLGVEASIGRRLKAFMVSVPVVYILNIFRNVFVVMAASCQWFGPVDYSFYIAHYVVAKIGSTIALVLIAYAVLQILPELLDAIVGIAKTFKEFPGGGQC